ncbi:MAG: hypothetical protein QXE75_04475 [Sulfolobales archaeon]
MEQNDESRFFVKRYNWIVSPSFARDVKAIERTVSSLSRNWLIETYSTLRTRTLVDFT